MISRVAEHCFWLSRYLERAENTARVLDVNQTLLLDFDVPLEQQWRPLLIITGCHFDAPWAEGRLTADGETVQNYLTWDRNNASSIASAVAAARENARVIREVVSAEMWERLNWFHLWMQGAASRNLYDRSRGEFYRQIKEINQSFHGITDGTMSHGRPWDFLQFGKYLERANQTARILDVKYHLLRPADEETPVDNANWTAVLKSCSAYEPFHKQRRHTGGDLGADIAEFLILDRQFPRSVLWCLARCRDAVRDISGAPTGRKELEIEKGLDALIERLRGTDIDKLLDAGLHESLTEVINAIHGLGDACYKSWFDVKFEMPSAAA